jgi:Protein of unknown function (DUF2510)
MNEQSMGAGWYTDPAGMNDPRVQRYWDGSGWTAQRAWNGAQWVETAQGAPAPVVAPLAVPPKHRHRGLWIGGGAALAVAVVGVVTAVALSAGGSHKGPGSVAAHTSSPAARVGTATQTTPVDSSSDPSSAGSANAMRAWENSLGEQTSGQTNAQAINAVEKDIVTIGKDYSSQADDTTLFTDCQQLDPGHDGGFIPTDSPDQTVNANLSKASDYLLSASVDCDVDDQAAATELNKVIDYLNTATSEIKSLGG